MNEKRSKVMDEQTQDQLIAVRQKAIEEAAYYKAEQRGFVPGLETQDWLEAEQEINEAHGL